MTARATPRVGASIGRYELAGQPGFGTALLAYSVALPLLLLVPPALKGQSGFATGFTWQEVVDLFTPVVLLPMFALALARAGGMGRLTLLALVVIASAWVSGQAMHLAANAVDDAAVEFGSASYAGSVPGQLTDWIDEVLSHWLWHAAWVALLLLLAWTTLRMPAGQGSAEGRTAATVGGAIQGFTWFVVTVEGVTGALGIPAAALFVGLGLAKRRAPGTPAVTAAFLLATGAVALSSYGGWAAINLGALPEFSHWVAPW